MNTESQNLLEMHVGDLLQRRRIASGLIEGRRISEGGDLLYGYMRVVLVESGDPTVVQTYDPDDRPHREIEVTGEDPQRVEELQEELDRAYLSRCDNL